MVEKEFRRGFIARLLLFSASQLDGVQGSTTCGNCAANMTFGTALESSKVVKDREQRRQLHTNYVVDSGATLHCINDISLFDSIDHDHPPVKLRVANGKILVAHAVGTVKLKLQQPDGSITEVLLHNVVFHPDFSHNLLSVRRLWRDNRIKTRFGERNYFKEVSTQKRFYFQYSSEFKVQSACAVSGHRGITPDVLHSRFGHCGARRLRQSVTRSANFPRHESLDHDPTDCDACQEGGARRRPFPKRVKQQFTMFGQRLSSDLCGPFPESVGGHKYALCIVDAATNFLYVEYLNTKSSGEVRAAFDRFLRRYKRELDACRAAGFDVTWRTDNGGEFTSSDLDEFCEEFAVKRSFSVPYAPPQNAHAERMWGILLRTMRITIAESKISERFWTYAMQNAVRLHNSLPSTKLDNNMSPYQAFTGKLPNLGKFRVFGCVAWYYLPEHERSSKIGPRALPAINLGCDPERNGWLVYIPQLNRISTMYHGSHQERKFMSWKDDSVTAPALPSGLHHPPRRVHTEDRDHEHGGVNQDHGGAEHQEHDDGVDLFDDSGDDDGPDRREDPDTETHFGDDHCEDTNCTLPRGHGGLHSYERVGTRLEGGPRRQRRPAQPSAYERNFVRVLMEDSCGHWFTIATSVNLDTITIPNTFEEAVKSRFSTRWHEAMVKEITDLLKNETWEPVDRSNVPAGKRITSSKWVYDIKYLRDGTVERFKARFVARGFSQVEGSDFTHTFSATLRATSFRLFLAIAAGRKLSVDQFDVTSAFTQAEIDAEIYVEPPKGFATTGKDGRPQVLRLKKALYGTKQAARLWQQALVKRLKTMGFTQSAHDPCLFRYVGEHGECLVAAYVDDLLCATSNQATFQWFYRNFMNSDTNPDGFRGKHLGKINYFLGMAIDQHADYSISVHQTKYIEKMLDKFVPSHSVNSVKHSKPCSPEAFARLSIAKDDNERERVSKLPYLQIIGSLLYLSTMTRPDISFYVTMLCKYMHDPSLECYDAAVSLLLYVGATKDLVGLHYDGSTSPPEGIGADQHNTPGTAAEVRPYIENNYGLVGYSDASWRSKLNDYSSYGYVVYLFGGVVSFASKFLKVVAMSSAEAEYAAASQTCREMTYVRNVCGDLGLVLRGRLCLAVDNTAAIAICENPGVTARNKHFSDAVHYVRHEYDHGRIRLVFVTTDKQRADGFTKPLESAAFHKWRRHIISAHPPV